MYWDWVGLHRLDLQLFDLGLSLLLVSSILPFFHLALFLGVLNFSKKRHESTIILYANDIRLT